MRIDSLIYSTIVHYSFDTKRLRSAYSEWILREGVKRDLDLEDNTGLKELPQGLKVRGSLWLRGCTGLKELPMVDVEDSIILTGCVELQKLPENLTVNEDLGLRGCISLTSLPNDLKVGGNLGLSNCINLKTLPSDLVVKGDLLFRGVPGWDKVVPVGVTGTVHTKEVQPPKSFW